MRVSRANQASPVVWYTFVRNKLDAKTARGGGTKSNELRSATRAPWRFPVRRHPFAPIKAAIFLRRPVSLVAPCLKIRFRSLREKHLPCILKFGAGLVEGGRGAVCAFARMAARIEAAVPPPGILPGRHAGAERDHADPHVAVIDVPAFFPAIGMEEARWAPEASVDGRTTRR